MTLLHGAPPKIDLTRSHPCRGREHRSISCPPEHVMPGSGMAPCWCVGESIRAMPLCPRPAIPFAHPSLPPLLSFATTRCKSASTCMCFASSCQGGEQTTTITPKVLPLPLCICTLSCPSIMSKSHALDPARWNPRRRRRHPPAATRVKCNTAWRAWLVVAAACLTAAGCKFQS